MPRLDSRSIFFLQPRPIHSLPSAERFARHFLPHHRTSHPSRVLPSGQKRKCHRPVLIIHSSRPTSGTSGSRRHHYLHDMASNSLDPMRHARLQSRSIPTMPRQRRQESHRQEPNIDRDRPYLQPLESAHPLPLPQCVPRRLRRRPPQLVTILAHGQPAPRARIAVRVGLPSNRRSLLPLASGRFLGGHFDRRPLLRPNSPQLDRETQRPATAPRPPAERFHQSLRRAARLFSDLRLVSGPESRGAGSTHRLRFLHRTRGPCGFRGLEHILRGSDAACEAGSYRYEIPCAVRFFGSGQWSDDSVGGCCGCWVAVYCGCRFRADCWWCVFDYCFLRYQNADMGRSEVGNDEG